MKIDLKEVTNENLMEYAEIVLELCKEHFELRNNIGYEDYEQEVENYNIFNIIGDFKKRGTNYYFITKDNEIIGTIASYERNSEINNEPIIYIDSFYILPQYRKNGYGKSTIEQLKKMVYPKKIELHCLYGNNAELFYDKIGGKKVKIVYSFES